jgi:hypothetical protein
VLQVANPLTYLISRSIYWLVRFCFFPMCLCSMSGNREMLPTVQQPEGLKHLKVRIL